jgi:transcriptional regulator with XRE-family HTH domain
LETKNPTLADQHVGRRLRWRREELELSQQELADRLGVTFQQIQKYENGRNRISAGRLFDMAQALETRIMYFYEGLDTVMSARRGVAEEAARFDAPVAGEVVDMLIAFQTISDSDVRKSIISSVKKQAKQARVEKPRAKPKSRSSKS